MNMPLSQNNAQQFYEEEEKKLQGLTLAQIETKFMAWSTNIEDYSLSNDKIIVLQLQGNLENAGKTYFTDKATTIEAFQNEVIACLTFASNRVCKENIWNPTEKILRAILGIIAIATILPAIVIQATTKAGYEGTFWTKPKHPSVMKLEQLKDRFLAEVINQADSQIKLSQ